MEPHDFHGVILSVTLLVFGLGAGRVGATWHQCNKQAIFPGAYGAEAIARLSEFRATLLSQVSRQFELATQPNGLDHAPDFKRFDPFNPILTCPEGQPLIRYGNPKDGGKVFCDIGGLKPPCVVYSLGSNGDFSFEEDILNRTQCAVHTFDCTYDGKSLDNEKRHFYHKTCVGTSSDPSHKSWDQITTGLGHKVVHVLKVDIEGYEVPLLGDLRDIHHLPQQIVIEVHFLIPGDGQGMPSGTVRNQAQMALLFMHLATLGYASTYREDNIYGARGCCAEFSFLHVEAQHPYRPRGTVGAVTGPWNSKPRHRRSLR